MEKFFRKTTGFTTYVWDRPYIEIKKVKNIKINKKEKPLNENNYVENGYVENGYVE